MTSSATYTTGGSTDLAGLSGQLTVSNANNNAENTGITLGLEFSSSSIAGDTAEVDAVQLTIYYTAPAGGANQALLTMGVG